MRIVSGGQTGVDRAALDAALALGLRCGGWCPAGRWAEDGPLPPRYPLCETPTPDPAQRTWWNVRDSDGTLVLVHHAVRGGTALTLAAARALRKPWLLLRLGGEPAPRSVRVWMARAGIRTLNVAGPRESQCPGIYRRAFEFLSRALAPASRPPQHEG